MAYIRISTQTYPMSERDIREAHPNTSFADPFRAPDDYAWVFPTPQPTHDPISQSVREIAPAATDKGIWEQQWEVIELDAETVAINQAQAMDQTKKSYEAALDAHFLAAAKAKGYDTQYTCALRAGYPGPFHDEGVTFATWMDNCNVYAFGLMGQVLAGTAPMPSMTDFLAGLPVLTWPSA